MLSAVTYLTLGALAARAARSRAVEIYLIGLALLATFLVGASRVYLGVHWPSDVLAGWCAGASWAMLCWLVAQWILRRDAARRGGENAARLKQIPLDGINEFVAELRSCKPGKWNRFPRRLDQASAISSCPSWLRFCARAMGCPSSAPISPPASPWRSSLCRCRWRSRSPPASRRTGVFSRRSSAASSSRRWAAAASRSAARPAPSSCWWRPASTATAWTGCCWRR